MLRLALALLVLALPVAAQESVVTGLSTANIALNATFDGSDIFVFGAIRRDAPAPASAGRLDIIITIKGPPRAAIVRRKERRLGIWINTDTIHFRGAPSFYAIATTTPVDQILTETERLRYGIGMDQAVRRVGGQEAVADITPFAQALVRLKSSRGLYAELDGGVRLAEDILFQTSIAMPANLTEGDYAAEFFLVRNREVISSGATTIRVEKTGIERWIYNLATDLPFVYGLASIAVALAAGWLAATAFRLVRR